MKRVYLLTSVAAAAATLLSPAAMAQETGAPQAAVATPMDGDTASEDEIVLDETVEPVATAPQAALPQSDMRFRIRKGFGVDTPLGRLGINPGTVTVSVAGAQTGIATDGRRFARPLMQISGIDPQWDAGLSAIASQILTLGDNYQGGVLDNVDTSLFEEHVLISVRNGSSATSYMASSDGLFDPVNVIGVGVEHKGIIAAVGAEQNGIHFTPTAILQDLVTGDKLDWQLTASSHGVVVAEGRYNITPNTTLSGFVGTQGAGIRGVQRFNVSEHFQCGVEGSYTTRLGASAGAQCDLTRGPVTLSFGAQAGKNVSGQHSVVGYLTTTVGFGSLRNLVTRVF